MYNISSMTVELLFWCYQMGPYLWRFSGGITSYINLSTEDRLQIDVVQSTIFMTIVTFLSSLKDLPFGYYMVFFIESKWNFNLQSRQTFFSDFAKKTTATLVLVYVMNSLFLWVLYRHADYVTPIITTITVIFLGFSNILVPVVIIPILFNFKPIEDLELMEDIIEEANKCGLNIKEVVVIDGSRRTSHSNCFVCGFGQHRKVVLFDTLIAQ
jgi:STE24 endopeptidase